MTQAPATPSLVERVKEASCGAAQSYLNSTPWRGALRGDAFLAGVAWVISDPGFAALEAQQARIAELSEIVGDVAGARDEAGVVGTGADCIRFLAQELEASQALADRYEKALRLAERELSFAVERMDRRGGSYEAALIEVRQALSSQGRHEGGER